MVEYVIQCTSPSSAFLDLKKNRLIRNMNPVSNTLTGIILIQKYHNNAQNHHKESVSSGAATHQNTEA